tara:strand:+ start:230 stop:1084 length:855 start_codon:yes stop_codon:yes gene_type:complete
MNENLNKEIENKNNFINTGIYVKKNFLNENQLKKLLSESENIFNNKIDNSALGAQATTFKPNFFSITCPTLSINLNLFEIAVDILDEMKNLDIKFNKDNFELTNIDILKDTTKELFWHTDNTKDFYRAFIYLKGGKKDSGAFKCMVGTHMRDYEVNHKLSHEIIKKKNLENKIVICDYEPGSLIVADINAFHSNSIKKNDRIIMIFDYQRKDINIGGSFLPIKTTDITNKVINNLNLFSFKGSHKNKRYHGIEKRLNNIGNTTKPNTILLRSVARYFKEKIKFW